MAVFVSSGPAEILRAVQKDKILCDLIEKHLTNILLKTGGTTVWLRNRQYVSLSSRFLYYFFTTLSGFQTLGEEYTNIVQVDSSLRHVPSFLRRLLMTLLDVGGCSIIELFLDKLQRRVNDNVMLHDDFKHQVLCLVSFLKAALPYVIHLHLIIFYWNGAFYNLAKRITGIHYILTKPWLSKNNRVYGFKILAGISLFHVSVSLLHATYKWYKTPNISKSNISQIRSKGGGKCSLCLERRINTSSTLCGHLFCWSCILEWLRTNNQCPICRDIIEPSRIIPLQNFT